MCVEICFRGFCGWCPHGEAVARRVQCWPSSGGQAALILLRERYGKRRREEGPWAYQ